MSEKKCQQCFSEFRLSQDDLDFLDRISPSFAGTRFQIPLPRLCPNCRLRRRLVFRNERSLYKRRCDHSGKMIVSAYSPDKSVTVYENDTWWGDAWDPLSFGRDYDPDVPFFKQFRELVYQTPLVNLLNTQSENSVYTHNATYNKDCYMLFCGSYNQSCLYCYWIQNSTDCVDCFGCRRSELCYECIDCDGCYELFFSQNCRSSSSSCLLYDCVNCSDCVACCGLRGKSYYWLNEKLPKEEFSRRREKLKHSYSFQQSLAKEFESLCIKLPRAWSQQRRTESCSGDYCYDSKNCRNCFDAKGSEDCAHCQNIVDVKDSRDITFFGLPGELLYECCNIGINSYHCLFSSYGYGNQEIYYCYNSHFCCHLFGCANIHHKKYCVLNKQYSETEYARLVSQIISDMTKREEWGEFFPASLSPFCYNETTAQDYFPLLKDEALQAGYRWQEDAQESPSVKRTINAAELPDDVGQCSDCVLDSAIICQESKRPFRITRQELSFYRRTWTPLPRVHPDLRYQRRLKLRNPRNLWPRQCANCSTQIETSFSPTRPEAVLCEKCYLVSLD